MEAVRTHQGAGRQGADPRRDRLHDELHRASRAGGRAHRPLCHAGGCRECHRRHGLWLRHLGRAVGRRSRYRLGQARRPRRGSPAGHPRVLSLEVFHVTLIMASHWLRRLGGVQALLTVALLLVIPLCPAASVAQPPAPAAVAPEEKLPTDPALVTGRLPNGLRSIIRPHPNPEGRVSIWLHVDSGSLNETDATQGLAHFLEHLAFNGSAHFPPGSGVPFFQSLGLSFRRDPNAVTGFHQTTYQLAPP